MMPKQLKAKHLAGVLVSIALFSMFTMAFSLYIVAFTGVSMNDPIRKLATGETTIPMSNIIGAFGFTHDELYLPETIILPGFSPGDLVFSSGGTALLDLTALTLGQASGAVGALLGAAVGMWYLVDIIIEKQREPEQEDMAPLIVEMKSEDEVEGDWPDDDPHGESQSADATSTISCDNCGGTARVNPAVLDEQLSDNPDRPIFCKGCA